jgi:hypothetical protein
MARQSWDKTEILQTLKKLHREGKDLSYARLGKRMQPLLSAAAYHFGSYRAALEKAGIDYGEVVRRPRWTKPQIIRLIKEAKRAGSDLHWSAVTKRRDELGRAAFASLQERLFGSWDRALHAAGLDADEISQYRKWGKDSIVFDLRERYRDGEALNSGTVQKEDPGLHAAAVRHFGGYEAALRAAKVDPRTIRRRHRWSREEVNKQLKAFARRHPVSDASLRKHAPALYGAVLRIYKTVAGAKRAI